MTNVVEWKKYLNKRGEYVSDNLDGDEIDDNFKQALIKAEGKLTHYIPSIKGLVVCKGTLNPSASVSDYDAGLKLLEKQSQATLDAMGPPPDWEEMPSATRQMVNSDESAIETGDSASTQMNGVMVNKLPKKTLDDRILELAELESDKNEDRE